MGFINFQREFLNQSFLRKGVERINRNSLLLRKNNVLFLSQKDLHIKGDAKKVDRDFTKLHP